MEVHLRSFGVKYQMTTATTELEADTKNIDFIQKKPEMWTACTDCLHMISKHAREFFPAERNIFVYFYYV